MPRSKPQAFPRERRIRKRADYLRIQGGGSQRSRKISQRSFLAFFVKTGLPQARVGITVSRRVGGAVVRNRVKRLLREAFRRQGQEPICGFDVVIIASPRAATATYEQVSKEVVEICRKASASH